MEKAGGKIITVVVPRGEGPALLQRLYERKTYRAALGQARAPVSMTKGKGTFRRTVQVSRGERHPDRRRRGRGG